MLTQLLYIMCATVAQFIGIGPFGDLIRVAAGPIEIREEKNRTYMNSVLHSFNDQPAVENAHGDKYWYRHGKIHRDNDLPSIEYANGNKIWYRNGEIHRDNYLPAQEYTNNKNRWYRNGKFWLL